MEKDELVCRSDYPPRPPYPEPYPFRPNYDSPPPIIYPVDERPSYYYRSFPSKPLPRGETWPSEPFPNPIDPWPIGLPRPDEPIGPCGNPDTRNLPICYMP